MVSNRLKSNLSTMGGQRRGDQLRVIDRLEELALTERQHNMLVDMVMSGLAVNDVFSWWNRVG